MGLIRWGLAAAAVCVALVVGVAPSLMPGTTEVEAAFTAPRGLTVEARPIAAFRPSEPERRRFGGLDFVGGLVLKSRDRAFGGLSGLRTLDHGRRLLAISDEGSWFTARLAADAAGRPTAVTDAIVAPLLDEARRPFRGKYSRDAESLTLRPVGDGWEARVGFERRHRVVAYRATGPVEDLVRAPGRAITIPVEIGALPTNEGLEAIADTLSGAPLVLIAETPGPGAETNPGWILGGSAPGRFRLATSDSFAVTDAAFLPSGDLLVLQRRLAWYGALAMRLVRVARADLVPGRVVTGDLVYESTGGDEIDNMEGLAVDVDTDGATLITLVSDDNFFWLQRTLLLRFRLVDSSAKT